jgi:phosphate:Na+ symporter
MTPTLVLLQIVAGVCLFLYGIRQVRRGIMRGFGAGLRRFVAACTAHRVTGFLAGVISTMILQSAGAVTMIMATFLGQKILPTAAALAVVIGADVGVAIMTQILTFDLSWLGPVFLLAGFILLAGFEHRKPIQNVGLSFFGLGLMLFALGWIAQASRRAFDLDAAFIAGVCDVGRQFCQCRRHQHASGLSTDFGGQYW